MQYQPLDPSCGGLVVHPLPQHLQRGVHFYELMSSCGWLLRTRPDSLSVEEQEKLHNLTAPVSTLKYFLSHCWRSSGHQKYIALLLYFTAHRAMLAGTCATAAVLLWQRCYGPLPCFEVLEKRFETKLCYSPWEFIVGGLVTGAALLLGPYCIWDRPAFFDATCIPQAPLEAKLEGIRHLPSFVAACEDMIIAWDPLYVTRAWCVYEVAVYKGLFPHRRIIVLPIQMYAVMFACHLCTALAATTFFVLAPICGNTAWPVGLSTLTLGLVAARGGEELELQRQECDRQLAAFDFNDAAVQVESDRIELETSINALWRGGLHEFNMKVRTEIREEVLGNFDSCRAMLPYSFMLIATFPMLPFSACFATTYWPLPAPVRANHLISGASFSTAAIPCLMAFAMHLGARCGEARASAGPVPWRPRHAAVALLFVALCTVYTVASVLVPDEIATGHLPVLKGRWWGPLIGAVASAASAGMSALLFCPRRSQAPLGGAGRA